MSDRTLFMAAVALYGACLVYSIFLWRRGFRQDTWILFGWFAAGLASHTVAMFARGFRLDRCPIHNLYEATVFALWTIAAASSVLCLFRRLRFLAAFVSPLLFGAGVFALFPTLDERGPRPAFAHGWESLHAALVLLSYGAFGLSAMSALMYLFQVHNINFDKARALFAIMPPLQRLERIFSGLLTAGFSLLTVGLVVGWWWLRHSRGSWLALGDPKVLWSALVWAGYLALLVVRRRSGAGGRRYAWGVVGAFAFLLLTFWGTNLPSQIHHP